MNASQVIGIEALDAAGVESVLLSASLHVVDEVQVRAMNGSMTARKREFAKPMYLPRAFLAAGCGSAAGKTRIGTGSDCLGLGDVTSQKFST
jgi:hypothetical protein